MPEEYAIIGRDDVPDYPRAQEIQEVFAANPSAKTLMVLYDKNDDNRVRSVYQSPARFDDDARNYPEKNHEVFYHASGEKLVNLVMEVGCDLSAYGQTNVLVPQRASDEEVRNMAYIRAQSVSNWDDPFGFQEDWSTVEGLRVNRVVEVVRGPDKNRARDIAQDIPVEFAPSKYGMDVFKMLESAERGATIPAEVFMYAATRQAQASGENFAPEFVQCLKIKAQTASENAVYKHMMDNTPLRHDMLALNAGSDDVTQYRPGSVLRGAPDDPVEYRVYQSKNDADLIVLAGVTRKDVMINSPEGTDWRIEKGTMHAIKPGLVRDHFLKLNEFQVGFVALDRDDAEAALVEHFGYQRHAPAPSGQGMDMDAT